MSQEVEFVPLIIPTVMIPLTLISVGISVVASFIAALFGVELKMEGPKKFLEVLFKPKVLLSALFFNLIIWATYVSWKWWMNYPKMLVTIESELKKIQRPSNKMYTDAPTVQTHFVDPFTAQMSNLRFPRDSFQLQEVWKTQTSGAIFRAAVVSASSVFVGTDKGYIEELDLFSGKKFRSFYTGTAATSELTIANQSLYTGEGIHDTHSARVYRFNLKTGDLINTFQTRGHTEAQAVFSQFEEKSYLLLPAGGDGLYVLDAITLNKIWHFNPGHMDAAVFIDKGVVYLGNGREKNDDKKNKCYAMALDLKTGKELWKRELAASSWMRPVVWREEVCWIQGEIYFPSQRGHVTCFAKSDGAPLKSFHFTQPLAATPKVIGDSLLVTSLHGQICRLSLLERKIEWCYETQEDQTKSLAGASYDPQRDLVVYASMTKGLFVLDAKTGALVKNWSPEDHTWSKTYADVHTLTDYWIIVDESGLVRALHPSFSK
jgi:outer membrane protein assembly factor BamB